MQNFIRFQFLLLLLFAKIFVFAQSVGINDNGSNPDPSSILDVYSTDKGMLIPRLSTAQRNAIVSPADGLLIYNTDCKDINLFNGTVWISMLLTTPSAAPASGFTTTSFVANWVANGGTTYYLDVATDPFFMSIVPGYNNLNVGNVISYNVTGLVCGSNYYYRVRSSTICGNSPNSNVVTASLPCCITSYNVTSIPYAPLSGAGNNVVLIDDNVSASLPIGFTFSFYCINYTNFFISSNGFISFANQGDGCCSGQCLPNITQPNNLIALAWDDLYPNGNGIQYFTTGVAPFRKLVVSFTNIAYCCSATPSLSSQIILYETTNIVEVHVNYITNITPGTIGLENATGTFGTAAPGRSCAGWSSGNEAWRFF